MLLPAAFAHMPDNPFSITVGVWTIGATVGLLQGWLVTRYSCSPLLLTLGTALFLLGLATVLSVTLHNAGVSTLIVPKQDVLLFSNGWVWLTIVVTALTFWRYFTHNGLQHLAVGLNRSAAALVPLPVARIRRRAFVLASFLVTLAMFLLVHYTTGWGPRHAAGYELLGIAAAVIGGTKITGGKFNPLNVVLAALVLTEIEYVSNVAECISPEMQGVAVGALVLCVALIDRTSDGMIDSFQP